MRVSGPRPRELASLEPGKSMRAAIMAMQALRSGEGLEPQEIGDTLDKHGYLLNDNIGSMDLSVHNILK